MSRKSTGVIITLKLDLFLNSIWTSEAAALWKKTKVHHLLVKSFFFFTCLENPYVSYTNFRFCFLSQTLSLPRVYIKLLVAPIS